MCSLSTQYNLKLNHITGLLSISTLTLRMKANLVIRDSLVPPVGLAPRNIPFFIWPFSSSKLIPPSASLIFGLHLCVPRALHSCLVLLFESQLSCHLFPRPDFFTRHPAFTWALFVVVRLLIFFLIGKQYNSNWHEFESCLATSLTHFRCPWPFI